MEDQKSAKHRPAWRWWLVPAAIVGALLGVLLTYGLMTRTAASTGKTFDVTGQLIIKTGPLVTGLETPCAQMRQPDLHPGATVTVLDRTGTAIGTGTLGNGTESPTATGGPPGSVNPGGTCTYPFTVTDVPTGKKTYVVRVADRNAITVDEADMPQAVLTLGLY